MIFTFCTFLPVNTAFAGGSTYSQEAKTPIPTRPERQTNIIKNHYAQKAFLVGLICALGIDVTVKFHPFHFSKYGSFVVTKVDYLNLYDSPSFSKPIQITKISNFLKNQKELIDFEVGLSPYSYNIFCAKVNKCFLLQNTINKIGNMILELIFKKAPHKPNPSEIEKTINLTEDPFFRQEVMNILEDVIDSKHDEKSLFNFFTLYSEFSFKKQDPIQNPKHINYIKQHPKKFYNIAACYEKTFFIGILSLFKIDAEIKTSRKSTVDFIKLESINNIPIQKEKKNITHLKAIIKCITSILPPEKLKIEYQDMGYPIPIKIILDNKIILYENDIFNLGQKLYNSISEIISRKFRTYKFTVSIRTDEFSIFSETIKNIFEEYTTKELVYF